MGKGDKRTKRGKLFRGSRGKSNPIKKTHVPVKTEAKPAAKARAPREPKEQPTAMPAAEE